MRKGRTLALIGVAALTAGLLALRACGDEARSGRKMASGPDDRASAKAALATAVVARPVARPPSKKAPSSTSSGSEPGEVFVTAAWGGGEGNLGRERPSEASPSGPMSFTVDGRGRVWVLDQVNGRVVRFDERGQVDGTIPVERPNAQDIALADDGTMAVLDRHGEKDVAIYGPDGALAGTLPLEGEGVESAGHVTGVFVDGGDVYVEHEHGPLVRIGSTSGAVAEPREEVPGRPSRDGRSWLKAGVTDAAAGRAYVVSNERPSGEHRFTRELVLHAPIAMLVLLDSDRQGTIYLGAEVDEGGEHAVVLVCLDGSTGAPTGTAILPANTMPEETFRDLVVLDEGGVVYAHRTEDGVTYEEVHCG